MLVRTEGIAPNASRLLWTGFMPIAAAGVGLCAHQSALKGGALVKLPSFTV